MYDHTEPKQLSVAEVLALAKRNGPIDRSEIGITTPKTYDGLEVFNDGFNFNIKLPSIVGKIAKFIFE